MPGKWGEKRLTGGDDNIGRSAAEIALRTPGHAGGQYARVSAGQKELSVASPVRYSMGTAERGEGRTTPKFHTPRPDGA